MSRFFLGLVTGLIVAYTALTLYGRIPHPTRAPQPVNPSYPLMERAVQKAQRPDLGNHRLSAEGAGARIKRSTS